MRENRFDRLLAGTVLAVAVAAPGLAIAAPRVETVYPAPPSLNGRIIRHQEPMQEPPPAARAQALPRQREATPVPPAPQPAAVRPEPAPSPSRQREADSKSGIDLSGTLDKLLSASDAQITPKLKRPHHVEAARQAHRAPGRPPRRRNRLRRARLCAAVDP